jgi:YggT family protein
VFAQAGIFLINTIGGLFTVTLLLRFLLQLWRAPSRNPLSDFLAALTNFAVRPARRLIPGWWGLDIATLVLAWLCELAQLLLVLQLRGFEFGPAVGTAAVVLALLAVLELAKLAVYIVMVAVVMQAVLSWINPYSPLAPLLNAVARPVLKPFRRIIPPVGNVDLSPLVALIMLQLVLMLPFAWLEALTWRLL